MNIPKININDTYLIVSNDELVFIIIDKNETILAYCFIHEKSDYYTINDIAAEKYYGVLLYDILMLYLDKPLKPSQNLTEDSFKVWYNYYHNRPDVIKNNSDKILHMFYISYETGEENTITDKELLKVINTEYTIFNKSRQDQLLNWYEISEQYQKSREDQVYGWKTRLINKGKIFFRKKYHKY